MSYNLFNKYYEVYDQWYIRNVITFYNECLCIKFLSPYGRVLDVGVGTGVFSKCLGNNVLGLDPAYNPLVIARKRRVEVVNAVGENMPFKQSSFDTIVMVVTICFLDEPGRVFNEIRRVLVDKGYLITCIVPRDSPWGEYYMYKTWRRESLFYEYARFYTKQELYNILKGHGFRVVDYCGTLSYKPGDPPYIEYPVRDVYGKGFVCYKAVKE